MKISRLIDEPVIVIHFPSSPHLLARTSWLADAFRTCVTVLSPFAVITFLAWDIPAWQMIPFRDRLRFLTNTVPFHLGFGLWFLIPVLNILSLPCATIGETLYHLERRKKETFATEIRH